MKTESKEKNLRIAAQIVAFIIVMFSLNVFAGLNQEDREKFDLMVHGLINSPCKHV